MKKKECPSCAMEIDVASKECPVCGYEFPETSNGLKIGAIILVILFIILLFFI